MINLFAIGAQLSKVAKKVGSAIKTFGRHKKDEGLPRFVESYQEYLKNAPKDFRRYDRRSKMYVPAIPRGKERKQSEAFQDFAAQLLDYSNTTPTYTELKKIKKNIESSEMYPESVSMNEAYEILEEQDAIQNDIEVSAGTNVKDVGYAITSLYQRQVLNGKEPNARQRQTMTMLYNRAHALQEQGHDKNDLYVEFARMLDNGVNVW